MSIPSYCFNCGLITAQCCKRCGLMFYCSTDCFLAMNQVHRVLCGRMEIIPSRDIQEAEYLNYENIRVNASKILENLKGTDACGVILTMRNRSEIMEPKKRFTLLLTKKIIEALGLPEELSGAYVPGQEFVLLTVLSDGRELLYRTELITAENEKEKEKYLFCATCRNKTYEPKSCVKCQKIAYCSKECQISNWPQHKKHCHK